MGLARPLQQLIQELGKLPGIGPKSAQRVGLYVLRQPEADIRRLAALLVQVREKVRPCRRCGNLTDEGLCPICTDEQRDSSLLCVVEDAVDVLALERAGYRGRYFVLNQDPRRGRQPVLEDLDLNGLHRIVTEDRVCEIIVATNPTVEGELTARFIARAMETSGVRVTRLAHGLPVGGDIEYTDELTLRRALEGRQAL